MKKMETTVYQLNISIFHKFLDLLISCILNNNNNNNNNNYDYCFEFESRFRENSIKERGIFRATSRAHPKLLEKLVFCRNYQGVNCSSARENSAEKKFR